MTEVVVGRFDDQALPPSIVHPEPVQVSVLVPAHNEEGTIEDCVRRAENALSSSNLRYEIIVIDDGSTDKTSECVQALPRNGGSLQVLHNQEKTGKGASLRSALLRARGDIVVVLDADLEYAPEEIPKVIGPIEDGVCDVVFGSRFLGQTDGMSLSHRLGNLVLTGTTNILYKARLTDVMTGYKAFKRASLDKFGIGQAGFAFEVEVAVKALRSGVKVVEVPISYQRRRIGQSKIRWTDGLRCLSNLIRLRKNHTAA